MSDILIRVTYVDYVPLKDDGSKPTVRICGRSADGERVTRYVRGCRPHCYVPTGESLSGVSDDVDIHDIESGYETYDDVPVDRVTVRHPKEVNVIDDAHGTWESDIPFYRRATWDYGLSGYIRVPDAENCHVDEIETDISATDVDVIRPRTVIGDIEVKHDGSKTFEEMKEDAEDPIVAVTLYDSFTEAYLVGVVDPEDAAEGSAVKAEMEAHWSDHDLAAEYLDADIRFVQAESETDLLNVVIGQIQKWRPDLLSGWNWIDFDHAYLTDRARALDDDEVDHNKLSDIGTVGGYNVETRIDGLPGFDQMQAYEDKVTLNENRSSALEYVANEEIGIGKIDAVDVSTAYETDRSRLTAYNLLDVQLCVALTDKHAMEEFYLDLADLTGIQVYDVFFEKRLVDGWIASRADDDQVLPNQYDRDIPEPAGGLVLSPADGIKEDIAVLDLKSLYPSSMISGNISPETKADPADADIVIPGMPEKEMDVGGRITEADINWSDDDPSLPWSQRPKGFTLDDQGILAEAAEGPFFERERYKVLRDDFGPNDEMYVVYDRKQGAVKVVHNSMYGVINSDYYRLAEPGIGDAITGVSRYVLWRAAVYVEELGYEVIYGDTDSVLVKIPGDRDLEEKLLDARGLANQLNDHMGEVAADLGIPEDHPFVDAEKMPHDLPDDATHLWFFEFEKFYGSFIQCGSKKRYGGKLRWKEGKTIDDDAEPDITGFESQRADVPKITAEVQTEVIDMVLSGADFSDVSGYVRGEIEDIRRFAHLEEIGIPMSISKPLEEYPNRPRVRAAEHSNEHLGYDFGPGDTFWMFYAARVPVGTEGTDVFGIEWNEAIPEGYEVDEETTIVKAFESALEPIIEEVGWTFSELRAGKRTQAAEEAVEVSGDPFRQTGAETETTSTDTPDESSEGSDDEDDEWEGAEAW